MISQFKRDQTAKIMRLSKALDLAQTVVALSADELDRRSKKTAGPDAGQLKRMSGDLMKTSEALVKVHDLTEGSGGSTVEYTLKRQRFEEKLAAAQDVNCFVKKTVPPAEKKRKALGELTNVVSEKFRLPGVAQCENTPEARRKSAKMEAEIAPLPANGKKYTALECAKILAAAKNTGGLVNAMIENGYVDVRPARLYKLRDQYWNDPTSVRELGSKVARTSRPKPMSCKLLREQRRGGSHSAFLIWRQACWSWYKRGGRLEGYAALEPKPLPGTR